MAKTTFTRVLATTIASAAVLSAGCGDMIRTGRAPSYLFIEQLQGAKGSEPDKFGDVLQSDVRTNGSIFEDNGQVVLRLAVKDVGQPGNPNAPSPNNIITVNRYRVTFRRSDGRNTQGLDVPYAFEGAVTATVTTNPTSLVFSLVRAQAKLEAPLSQLAGAGGALLISTIADVTFYGHDQAGNETAVTGSISVNFADWADPDS